MQSIDSAKELIVRLVEHAPQRALDVPRIRLGFFFANQFAMRDAGGLVTVHFCVKLPSGVAPESHRELLREIVTDGGLDRVARRSTYLALANRRRYVDVHPDLDSAIRAAATKVGSEPLRSLEGEVRGMRSVQRVGAYEAIDFSDDVSDEARLRRSRELGKQLGF